VFLQVTSHVDDIFTNSLEEENKNCATKEGCNIFAHRLVFVTCSKSITHIDKNQKKNTDFFPEFSQNEIFLFFSKLFYDFCQCTSKIIFEYSWACILVLCKSDDLDFKQSNDLCQKQNKLHR